MSVLALLAALSRPALAGERTFYAAASLPITGAGFGSSLGGLLMLNLAPVELEYSPAQHVGIRGVPFVNYSLYFGSSVGHSGLGSIGGRLEVPFYIGATAGEYRLAGPFVGPWFGPSESGGGLALSGGVTGGYSTPLTEFLRLRGWALAGVTRDAAGVSLDYGGGLEFGALLF